MDLDLPSWDSDLIEGLILSVLDVMIMYLIKVFSEYNEWW